MQRCSQDARHQDRDPESVTPRSRPAYAVCGAFAACLQAGKTVTEPQYVGKSAVFGGLSLPVDSRKRSARSRGSRRWAGTRATDELSRANPLGLSCCGRSFRKAPTASTRRFSPELSTGGPGCGRRWSHGYPQAEAIRVIGNGRNAGLAMCIAAHHAMYLPATGAGRTSGPHSPKPGATAPRHRRG